MILNVTLIISWMFFISILFLILGFDFLKGSNSKLEQTFKVTEQTMPSIWNSVGQFVRDYYPKDKLHTLEKKLILAGNPYGLTVVSFLGIQFSFSVLALIVGANLMVFNVPFSIPIIIAIIMLLLPIALINRKIEKRQNDISKNLPDMVGLLATSVKSGVELSPSLEAISISFPGELGKELRKSWEEMAAGKQLAQALKDMASRTGVNAVKDFVETIATAYEKGGINLSQVLEDLSNTVTASRRRRNQELAKKIPTKMMLPMFACIFPSMLILLLTPIILMFINDL